MSNKHSTGCNINVTGFCLVGLAVICLLLALVSCPAVVRAGIIIDPDTVGATDVVGSVSGPLSNPLPPILPLSEDLYVGSTALGELRVYSSSLLITLSAFLGDTSTGDGTVTVTGASAWSCEGNMYVGGSDTAAGGSGTLMISDSGRVLVNNTLTIWDAGTVAQNGTGTLQVDSGDTSLVASESTIIGARGTGHLLVTGGGDITSTSATLGYSVDSSGTATITGSGSTWTLTDRIVVGLQGTGSLTISDGAQLSSDGSSEVGSDSYSADSEVIITGSGSTWTNSGSMYVGGSDTAAGGTGSLTISDSGSMSVSGMLKVWDSGTVNLNSAATLTVGSLDASVGTFNFNDGTLTINGGTYTGQTDLALDGATAGDDPTMTFTNGGSSTVTGSVYVGQSVGATLNIESGSQVSSASSYLGYGSGSTGTATVTGSDSTWTNSSDVYIGEYGSGTLNISDGGQVSSGRYGYIGHQKNSTGTATVTGSGSTWTNSSELRVGWLGNGTLNVEAGGQVSNTIGYLGYKGGSSGTATVTGSGSTWTNSDELRIGWTGGTGTLTISDGGAVSSATGCIGGGSYSTGTATVTGSGSTWTNSSDLIIGKEGSSISSARGTLNIEDGGQVFSATGYLGYDQHSIGTATVTGSGSTWTNVNDLHIGYQGNNSTATGTLNIESGGQVSNTTGYLGYGEGSIGTATVTGSGSTWSNSSDVYIGRSGDGTLNIEDGGQVSGRYGYIGHQAGSDGTATVTGSGSTWTNDSELHVGELGDGTLNIEDGGQVSNTYGFLGYEVGSTGTATVTGSGSTWSNNGSLYIGGGDRSSGGTGSLTVSDSGSVNVSGALQLWDSGTLSLSSGAAVTVGSIDVSLGTFNFDDGTLTINGDTYYDGQADLVIDGATSGDNPTLEFTIAASHTVTGDTYVGQSVGGTLNIESGSQVSSTTSYLGYKSGSAGAATVTGSGSRWTNSGNLYVGGGDTSSGGSGSVTISDSASVVVGGGMLKVWSGTVTQNSGTTLLMDDTVSGGSASGTATIGHTGTGVLDVSGGTVEVPALILAQNAGSSGTLNLSGGTVRTTSLVLGDGTYTLNLTGGTLQLVGDQTLASDRCSLLSSLLTYSAHTFSVTGALSLSDTLTIDGANVEADTMTWDNIAKVDAQSGSLTLSSLSIANGSTLDIGNNSYSALNNINFTFNVTTFDNSGTLRGNGIANGFATVNNLADGEIRVVPGDNLRLDGTDQLNNAGEIRLSGGAVQVAGDVSNTGIIWGYGVLIADGDMTSTGELQLANGSIQVSGSLTNAGLIAGYGSLRADSGTINQGTVNLTYETGITGNFSNDAVGSVNVLGGQTVTFFDDLAQNGDFYISDTSTIAVLGTLSGSEGFAGGGTVDLLPGATFSPGNSPALVTFGGDLDLSESSGTLIELGGLALGEYDRCEVAGLLSLGGDLTVVLWGGHTLDYSEEYEIFTADTRIGAFDNYGQGDLIGNYGGIDLFIDYDTSGGSVTLYTEVPEPATMGLLGLGGTLLALRRRRRR